MTPASAKDLQKLGYECVIETGAGAAAGFNDKTYKDAGVEVVKTAAALFKAADVVAKVRPPEDVEIKRLREVELAITDDPLAREAGIENTRDARRQKAKRGGKQKVPHGEPKAPHGELVEPWSNLNIISIFFIMTTLRQAQGDRV